MVNAGVAAIEPPVMALPTTYTGSGPTLKVIVPLTGVSVLPLPSQLVTVTVVPLWIARMVLPEGAQAMR